MITTDQLKQFIQELSSSLQAKSTEDLQMGIYAFSHRYSEEDDSNTYPSYKLKIKSEEIKNRLPENYSFTDIDRACDNLKDFKLKVSNLPFKVEPHQTKMVVKESKEPVLPKSRFDDEVDASLLRLANLD